MDVSSGATAECARGRYAGQDGGFTSNEKIGNRSSVLAGKCVRYSEGGQSVQPDREIQRVLYCVRSPRYQFHSAKPDGRCQLGVRSDRRAFLVRYSTRTAGIPLLLSRLTEEPRDAASCLRYGRYGLCGQPFGLFADEPWPQRYRPGSRAIASPAAGGLQGGDRRCAQWGVV
jgi:hypothetical protein